MNPMPDPVAAAPLPRWRRWALWTLVVLILVAGIGGGILYVYADSMIEQRLRPATIALLEERFDSRVELAGLEVSLAPSLRIRGHGLTLRHRGRTDIPPLLSIRTFTISTSIRELWERHLDRVHVEGLEIMIPPRRGEDMPRVRSSGSGGSRTVHIHELITESSLLTIMPKRQGKRPRVFQIRRLRFEDFQFERPTAFVAALTNPTPAGEIAVDGRFGPWQPDEPSLTPLEGAFTFDADLATIKGIGGALHAEGDFSGPLESIRTRGRTRTNGFYLSTGGTKFPLTADYDAIVDGTNGDTYLEQVEGNLAESHISARGAVVHVEGVRGRRITLDTTTKGGRLEDFVMLTTRVPTSPMTGVVDVTAKLDIPPGEAEVIERLALDGTFSVAEARFTSEAIQNRVDELSRRGVGRPNDETIDDVASNLRGSFQLKDARMLVRSLTFRVRGAEVRLAGTYDIQSERMNFKGHLRLQARASQTQTGWRSLVLKVFDPLLDSKGAGTVLPISITGTRKDPKFGVDLRKAILH